ncbi:MAG: DUF5071 domain-containing protein [Defluviitaleaceae bacterium]|nr:DUF5071 domain-containing protein [Defluviitaleaceae bacterium]
MYEKNLRNLIPKDKFDNSNIEKLMMLPEEDLKQILPELILWIADFNWPIAIELIPILIKYPNSILPIIKKNLQASEEDAELKNYIILKLIPELPKKYQDMLIKDIERIYKEPTSIEIAEEVNEIALNYLKNKK